MSTHKRDIPPVPEHFVRRMDDTFAIIRREAARGYASGRRGRSTGLLTALLTVVLLATAALAATNGGILNLFKRDTEANGAQPLSLNTEPIPPAADFEGEYVTIRVQQANISQRELLAVWTVENKSDSLLYVAEPVYTGLNGLRMLSGYIITQDFENWLKPGETTSLSMRWKFTDEPIYANNELVISMRINRSLSGEIQEPESAIFAEDDIISSGVAQYDNGQFAGDAPELADGYTRSFNAAQYGQFADDETDLVFAEVAVININVLAQ